MYETPVVRNRFGSFAMANGCIILTVRVRWLDTLVLVQMFLFCVDYSAVIVVNVCTSGIPYRCTTSCHMYPFFENECLNTVYQCPTCKIFTGCNNDLTFISPMDRTPHTLTCDCDCDRVLVLVLVRIHTFLLTVSIERPDSDKLTPCNLPLLFIHMYRSTTKVLL